MRKPLEFFKFESLDDLQLDIVGFLAILGEGSVLANAQVASLSKWFFIPRLVPAPQAFMRPSRPSKLEPRPGYVTGVYSGNDRDQINHIGNIVIDAESMPAFSVRCVEIHRNENYPDVKARTKAPLTAVAILGCVLSMLLLALAIWQGDGAALLANLLLSLLSTLIGVSNKWSLDLPKRKVRGKGPIPAGDVVIRYPKGSFLVIKCGEDVARELYFAPETINYMLGNSQAYRLLSLVGTMMLMFGVICLGNAQVQLQIGFAAAYMILNAAYWIVAALPSKMHWDTTAFTVKPQRFHGVDEWKHYASRNDTFTQALWKTLIITKSHEWVRRGEAAPQTPAWDEWLVQARDAAIKYNSYEDDNGITTWLIPDWDPQQSLLDLLKKHSVPVTNITASEGPGPRKSLDDDFRMRKRASIPHKTRGVPLTQVEETTPEKAEEQKSV